VCTKFANYVFIELTEFQHTPLTMLNQQLELILVSAKYGYVELESTKAIRQ
jgi:hypothetical protein